MTAKYLLAEVLKDEGYNTIIVEEGLSGLERAKEQVFDIVIIKRDIHDLNGLEIARQIRSEDNAILIVIILEWDDEIDDQIIKDIGINLVIKKPYQINSIIWQINKISGRI
jgi:DNA-binding response OmpR family regulator